jgi:hypothetical protein
MAKAVAKTGPWRLEVVKLLRSHRFVVLTKRWIVERTFAWIAHCRRLGKDFERHVREAAAFIRLAMIRIMLRRITAKPFTVNRYFSERFLLCPRNRPRRTYLSK